MSRATATGFFRASENSISPKGVLCGVTSCAGVDRREHPDGPAMCVMMFLASNRTPTEFKCTPSMVCVDVSIVDESPIIACCD